jgi:alpha-galactosidase
MTKIAYLGAASTALGRQLIEDILATPELRDCTLCLMDIEPHWLEEARKIAVKLKADNGLDGPEILATTQRSDALAGADYVLCTIRVGGLKAEICGAEIALDHNLKICLDGGALAVSRALYNVPILLDVCREMETLCPDALLINYTEPVGVAQAAIEATTSIRSIGLSYGVPDTIAQIGKWLDVPVDEIEHTVAGVTQMAWVLSVAHDGMDLYPRLREVMADEDVFWSDQVRFTLLKYFGGFVTRDKWSASDWAPYFRLRDEDIIGMNIPPMVGPTALARAYRHRTRELSALFAREKLPLQRSRDYGARLIAALETGAPLRFNGNVVNQGYVQNLHEDGCVEVPCKVIEGQIVPQAVGSLPPQMAAWDLRILNVEAMMLRAVLEQDREAVYQAVQLQPLTAAVMPIPEMREMVDETLAAQARYVPPRVAWQ